MNKDNIVDVILAMLTAILFVYISTAIQKQPVSIVNVAILLFVIRLNFKKL